MKHKTPALLFLASKQISSIFGSRLHTLRCKQCTFLGVSGMKETTSGRSVWGTWLSSPPESSTSPRKAADSIDWSSVHCPTKGSTLSIFTQCWAFTSDGGATTPSNCHLPALVAASLFSRCLTPPLLPRSQGCPV